MTKKEQIRAWIINNRKYLVMGAGLALIGVYLKVQVTEADRKVMEASTAYINKAIERGMMVIPLSKDVFLEIPRDTPRVLVTRQSIVSGS